jgi:hypothetical protein
MQSLAAGDSASTPGYGLDGAATVTVLNLQPGLLWRSKAASVVAVKVADCSGSGWS